MIMGALVLFCLLAGAWKRVAVYDAFVEGAREGVKTAAGILPALIAMLSVLNALEESGLTEGLCRLMGPVTERLHLPSGVLPLMLLRPFSFSGALAALEKIMENFGPDSRESLLAGVMMGSSETVFYTVTVYLSAAGVKRSGYIIPCALLSCLAGYAGALLFCP